MTGTIIKVRLSLLVLCLGAVILSQPSSAFEDDGEKRLLVLTNFVPPYAMSNDRGRVTGMDVELVRAWLDASEIDYTISMTSWSAAYKQTLERDNVLLFPLDRVREREGDFTWLNRLRAQQYYIYSRSEPVFDRLTLDSMLDEDWQVACAQQSVQCRFLTRMGLSDDRILSGPSMAIPQRMQMLQAGEIDLTIFDDAVFGFIQAQDDRLTDQLSRRFHVGETHSWIAGGGSLDPALMARLKATPWPGAAGESQSD